MMEMGSGHEIPGEAGRGARFETSSVVFEMGDDHFQDLWGEPRGLSIRPSTRSIDNLKCECIVDCGFGPLPDGELFYYDMSTTEHGNQGNRGGGGVIPCSGGVVAVIRTFRRGLVVML